MSGFLILTTEPTDIDFTVVYPQPISQAIFNNIFDDTITDKAASDSFLNGLFAYIITDIPLRKQLRSSIQAKDGDITPYILTIYDTASIKTELNTTAQYNATTFAVISTEWVSGNHLQFVFTITDVHLILFTIKFSVLVLMM
jgi:hypothetical protein